MSVIAFKRLACSSLVTIPVVVFAEENHNTAEEMTRALMLSHLTAIYIKQNLGTLSALCGCVVAATGSSCGITYLMGGGYEQMTFAVKNMIANLTGMICDGAKPSCAMKLTTGVSTAVLSAMLAMQGNCVTSVEGIIDDDVDRSIRNLVSIGADAMNETDHCVLDIAPAIRASQAQAVDDMICEKMLSPIMPRPIGRLSTLPKQCP